jgi:hypothetical protein
MPGESEGTSFDRTVLPPPDPSFEGEIEVAFIFSTDDTFDVGEDWGTPVSPTCEPPFKFIGILKRVTVEAKGS